MVMSLSVGENVNRWGRERQSPVTITPIACHENVNLLSRERHALKTQHLVPVLYLMSWSDQLLGFFMIHGIPGILINCCFSSKWCGFWWDFVSITLKNLNYQLNKIKIQTKGLTTGGMILYLCTRTQGWFPKQGWGLCNKPQVLSIKNSQLCLQIQL